MEQDISEKALRATLSSSCLEKRDIITELLLYCREHAGPNSPPYQVEREYTHAPDSTRMGELQGA
jgi:hypothetical protein